LIPAVGFLAVATSYITLALDLDTMLQLDLSFSPFFAQLIALCGPLALFLFISRDFLLTVGFVGAVFGAVNGMLVSLMAVRVAKTLVAKILAVATSIFFLAIVIWRILT
jgi:hypothetical protein